MVGLQLGDKGQEELRHYFSSLAASPFERDKCQMELFTQNTTEEAADDQVIIKSITFFVQKHSPTLGILGSSYITVPLGTVS